MNLVVLSPAESRARLASALPGFPTRDESARMPAEPTGQPVARLDVWLTLRLTGDDAAWPAVLADLATIGPIDGVDAPAANERHVRIPLVSISREFALGTRSADSRFRELARVAAAHAVKLEMSETVGDTIERTRALVGLIQGRNAHLAYELRPARRFSARGVFDAMLSLGWTWGDGDLFHWPRSGLAGPAIVSTSTSPGYFLPEDAATGATVDDLRFGLYAPFSIAPRVAHRAMVTAVEYAREVLGGTAGGDGGEPFDPADDARTLDAIVNKLEAAGLPPGSAAALAVF